jgi:formylglycine-generating enzyme required for sulfatase activity
MKLAVVVFGTWFAAAMAAPVAQNQSLITSAYTPITITLVATESSTNRLTYSIVSNPIAGQLSAVTGANVTYTPATNYYGAASFTFQANDGQTNSNPGTVTIEIPQIYQVWPYNAQEAAGRQNETAVALGLPTQLSLNLSNGVPMSFVLIPAGMFWMGTPYSTTYSHWGPNPPNSGAEDETKHQVIISKPFYLGVNHVTQLQWLTMMGTTVTQQLAKGIAFPTDNKFVGVGNSNPMYWINWDEATNFCQQVSTNTGMSVHLPTESQWEYAAQAGSGEMFFWGKNVPDVLSNYVWGSWNDGSPQATQPEGQLLPNPFGLYDIEGNVWVWCSDWYSNYPAALVIDPTGPSGPGTQQYGNYRICRGGSYLSGWGGMRTADRYGYFEGTTNRISYVGFRPAMDIPSASSTSLLPFMVTTPANQTVNVGQSVTFNVRATGATPLSYQWMENGANIAGATNANYTKSTVLANEYGAELAVAISNAYGRVVSGKVTLTVNNIPPVITTQPSEQSVAAGDTATFSVTAAGNVLPLTYQWTSNGVNIAGATNALYTTPPTAAGDNGTFFAVVVSNSLGGTVSRGVLLTVGTIRHISFQPDAATLPSGYQRDDGSVYNASRGWGWNVALGSQNRGNINADPRLNTYVYSQAVATWRCDLPNGSYTVNLACGDASAISGPQWVYVQDTVAIQVGGWDGGAGALIPTPINYFESATNFTATVTNGQLNVAIADGANTTTINYIDIIPVPFGVAPDLTTQPSGQTVAVGQTVTFSVTATGTAPLSYQWMKNGVNIPGATNAIYTIASPQTWDAGAYSVIISNAVGTVTATGAQLAVNPFEITSLAFQTNGILITWITTGGQANVVQTTTDLQAGFTNLGPNIIIPGTSAVTTNYLDTRVPVNFPALFYRVKEVP